MLVDSHAHIDALVFDQDRDQVVKRAKKAGVVAIVNAGFNLQSSRASLELAQRYPGLFIAVGFHPHSAARMKDGDIEELSELARQPKVVAIGEIGLDFYRNRSPRQAQLEAFKRQLELAQRLDLPVIVHSRNASKQIVDILSEWAGRRRLKPLGVIHCFNGDRQLAEKYIEMGFFLSVAGPVTYASSAASDVACHIPLDRLLIETDCPHLTPVPHRGRRNEPAYLPLVVKRIAQVREMSAEAVAKHTTKNATELFRLPLGDSQARDRRQT